MADPYVREVGRVEDMNGLPLVIAVSYDSVTLGVPPGYEGDASQGKPRWCFAQSQAEEFAGLYVAAVWQAGENARRMREEVPDG